MRKVFSITLLLFIIVSCGKEDSPPSNSNNEINREASIINNKLKELLKVYNPKTHNAVISQQELDDIEKINSLIIKFNTKFPSSIIKTRSNTLKNIDYYENNIDELLSDIKANEATDDFYTFIKGIINTNSLSKHYTEESILNNTNLKPQEKLTTLLIISLYSIQTETNALKDKSKKL